MQDENQSEELSELEAWQKHRQRQAALARQGYGTSSTGTSSPQPTDMNAVRDLAIEEIAKTWSLSAFSDSELSRHENGFEWLPGSHTVHVRIFDDDRKSGSPLPGRFRITISDQPSLSGPGGMLV